MRKVRRGVKLYMLAMLSAASSLVSAATFANYYSEAFVVGDVQVAKWEFDAYLNSDETDVVELLLSDETGLAASQRIAPGSSGSFTVNFYKGQTKTKQKYRIKTIRTSLPDNLRFYTNSACTIELTDTLEIDDTVTVFPVYWKWNFTDVNENSWQKQPIKATFLIQAEQKV